MQSDKFAWTVTEITRTHLVFTNNNGDTIRLIR